MTHDSEQDKHRFWELAARYIQLGHLLPRNEYDLDPDDEGAVVEARMVLDEMHKTKAEIDEILARNTQGGPPHEHIQMD